MPDDAPVPSTRLRWGIREALADPRGDENRDPGELQ
jgi:hypothetical protein